MPFAVIGGQAVNAYGISRQTGDLDLVVRWSDHEAWTALMAKLDYKAGQSDERFARFAPDSLAGWPIDLMYVDDETFSKLHGESSEASFGAVKARVVSARHLAALKIHALGTRQEHRYARDLSDLVGLLRSGKTGLTDSDLREMCVRYADAALYDKVKSELPRR
jgi:hypothetical protein